MICTGFTRSRKVKLAIAWYFFSEGATIGNWAALLPTVKEEQDLSNGTLGLVLIASVVGAILSLPFVSYVTSRFGSGFALFMGGLLLFPLNPIIGIKHNLPAFVLGVFALGFALGWMDICMNNQAVLCEKMIRLPTLGFFHGIYAVGGLCGALLGGALLETTDMTVFAEVLCFYTLIVLPQLCFSCWLLSAQEERLINQTAALLTAGHRRSSADDGKSAHHHLIVPELASILSSSVDGSSHPSQQTDWADFAEDSFGSAADTSALAVLCALCFLAYMGEGSVGDWSTIYLSETLHTSPLTSTLGYVAFALAVAVARFSSDALVLRFGRRALLYAAGAVAGLGLCCAAGSAWLHGLYGRDEALAGAIAGFALAGAGLGVVAPSVISLAGDVRGMEAADAIGLVSSLGYVGVMVGPPLLGGLAALCGGLEWSFFVDAACMLSITLLACWVREGSGGYDELRDSDMSPLHQHHADSIIQ